MINLALVSSKTGLFPVRSAKSANFGILTMETSSFVEKNRINRILRKLNFIAPVLSSIRSCIQKYAQVKLKFKIREPADHNNAGTIKYPIENI